MFCACLNQAKRALFQRMCCYVLSRGSCIINPCNQNIYSHSFSYPFFLSLFFFLCVLASQTRLWHDCCETAVNIQQMASVCLPCTIDEHAIQPLYILGKGVLTMYTRFPTLPQKYIALLQTVVNETGMYPQLSGPELAWFWWVLLSQLHVQSIICQVHLAALLYSDGVMIKVTQSELKVQDVSFPKPTKATILVTDSKVDRTFSFELDLSSQTLQKTLCSNTLKTWKHWYLASIGWWLWCCRFALYIYIYHICWGAGYSLLNLTVSVVPSDNMSRQLPPCVARVFHRKVAEQDWVTTTCAPWLVSSGAKTHAPLFSHALFLKHVSLV